ncbi:MAG TPA: sialidase family protein [Nitrososphaeraceae archaeon]
MENQKSKFQIHSVNNSCQLKFILFTILISSLLYFNVIFATNENNEKLILNDVPLQILDNNNNNVPVSGYTFSNITNITNNKHDSVYAQIAAIDNNVYVVWQESITTNSKETNYEIYLKKSEDQGNTFSKPINLSNNSGFSEHPQIAVSKNGIFIIWVDNTYSNNTEIMFTKSLDNGTTFSEVKILSNDSKNSNNPEISVSDENVYVVWQDIDQTYSHSNKENLIDKETSSNIMFIGSMDNGNTFNDQIELTNNTYDSYPKVNSYQNYVYVVWNSEDKSSSKDSKDSGLFFIRSSDNGESFQNTIRLVYNNFGESQISVLGNKVVIVWGGLHSKNINDIYFVKSNDNGDTFTDPYIIPQKVTKPKDNNYSDKINNPSNVEIANNDHSYTVWQDLISEKNQDIFIANIKNDRESNYMINLSNNTGISECPSIAISKNYMYIVWEDFTPGNHEILFTKGINNSS